MEALVNPKFVKALRGFAISFFTAVMMVMVTAIVIHTEEPTALCVSFAIITVASFASTIYFMHKIVKSND